MLDLFVLNATSSEKIPAIVTKATAQDLASTKDWQTRWTTPYAKRLPNKVALRRTDDGELLGLMSYELDDKGMAVDILYIESARHSNANLLHVVGATKKYYGIARALLAYAVQVSQDAGFDGVLEFRAKTSELREYYAREFGAQCVSAYDPFRMVIWEDAAERIIVDYRRAFNG